MLLNGPEAIFNSFLQPIPNKNSNWLQYLAFVENLFLILAAVLSFFIFPKTLEQKDKRITVSLARSEEHTSELQSRPHLVCRLLLEKKNRYHKVNAKRLPHEHDPR